MLNVLFRTADLSTKEEKITVVFGMHVEASWEVPFELDHKR